MRSKMIVLGMNKTEHYSETRSAEMNMQTAETYLAAENNILYMRAEAMTLLCKLSKMTDEDFANMVAFKVVMRLEELSNDIAYLGGRHNESEWVAVAHFIADQQLELM